MLSKTHDFVTLWTQDQGILLDVTKRQKIENVYSPSVIYQSRLIKKDQKTSSNESVLEKIKRIVALSPEERKARTKENMESIKRLGKKKKK